MIFFLQMGWWHKIAALWMLLKMQSIIRSCSCVERWHIHEIWPGRVGCSAPQFLVYIFWRLNADVSSFFAVHVSSFFAVHSMNFAPALFDQVDDKDNSE